MQFKEIYGQEKTKAYLRSLVNNKRVPHAFMFTGKKGSGKLAMALAFATYIQCHEPSGEDSCGNCAACRKSRQQIHPDIHYVMPTISKDQKSQASKQFYDNWRTMLSDSPYFDLNDWMNAINAVDKQGNIPKSSVQELMKAFSLKIYEGHKKIGIIWHSELLKEQGNRLLKLIEEPPENSVFILITENLDLVLNTIISRCQIINIPPFRDEDLLSYANKNLTIDSNKVAQLVQVANGDISELRNLAEVSEVNLYDQLFDWLRISFRANALEVIEWADTFNSKSKNNQKYFFKYGLSFFEQYYLSFSLDESKIRLTDEAFEILKKMKKVIDRSQSLEIIELMNTNILNLERNANVKLQMINSSLTLHKIMKGIQA